MFILSYFFVTANFRKNYSFGTNLSIVMPVRKQGRRKDIWIVGEAKGGGIQGCWGRKPAKQDAKK